MTDQEESLAQKITRVLDKKEPEPRLLFAGTLMEIPETGPNFSERYSGIYGPGGHSWNEEPGLYTMLSVKTDEGKNESVKYHGAVYPDSINNRVEVYRAGSRICVHDIDLMRWYR